MILSGAASKRDNNKGVVDTYLNLGINYTRLAKQVSLCWALDKNGKVLAHEDILVKTYAFLIGKAPQDGCPSPSKKVDGQPIVLAGAPAPAAPAGPDVSAPASPPGGGPPVGSAPSVHLAQGPAAQSGFRYAISLSGFPPSSAVGVSCRDSMDVGGFFSFTMTTDASGSAYTENQCFSGDGPDHWVVASGIESNHVTWGGGTPSGPPPPSPPPPTTWSEQETPNHPVNSFSNYHNASGQGPAVAAGQWIQVSCKVYDPFIASVNPDGYWYRIASPPWNNAYYSPANTFMNGDPYGGPYTHNTDFAVANC
jgi:hypothetical protein